LPRRRASPRDPRHLALAARLAAGLLCTLCAASPAHALDPGKRVTQYLHASWRLQDASAPAGIDTVTQTSDGFLWVSAFSRGVYTFDGVRFAPRSVAPKGGWTNKVFKVFADRAGGVWAVGDRGIAYLKDGAVHSEYQLDGLSSFQNAAEAPDGSLWLVRAATTVADDALCHVTAAGVKCLGKVDGVPVSPLDSIVPDGHGGFWLGGQTGLVHWRDGAAETYPIDALKSNVGQHGVASLATAPDATLWVGILAQGPGLGLGRLRDGRFEPFVTPGFDGSTIEVFAMMFDRDGNLWVASRGKGLYRIRGEEVEHYGRSDGLSSDSVHLMFEDREGIVWVGTSNGLDSFRDARVVTTSSSEGLPNDAATGVLASRDGSIWIANDGSLDRIGADGRVSSIRAGAGLPGHQVTSLLEDDKGNLWVGVDDSLYRFRDGRFDPVVGLDRKPLGFVIALAEDVDGSVWAASGGNPRKLVRIRDFEVREEFVAPRVPAARTLAADPRGGVWIATRSGDLARFHEGSVEPVALGLKGSRFIRRLAASADGSVLAATEDGLVGWRQGRLQRLTAANGLPCSAVISFVDDRDGNLWLYTDCGIVEVAAADLERWWSDPAAKVRTRVLDRVDGAQPNPPYFNPVARSPDGRLWFANGHAVQAVDPSRLPALPPPARAHVERIVVDHVERAATPDLRLPPRPRELQIDYTSPTLTAAQTIAFRYRLDPYDRDWHDAGTRRQAFYSDLPPGSYTFRVVAANRDGVWNETPATLDLAIAPVWFETGWFRALCVAAVLALVWGAYRLRVQQLRRRFALTLETRVAERTRIARELHDTLLQSFHGLLLRFQTVLELLPGRAAEARAMLASTIDQAAGAITEGRDAVQALRTSVSESNNLAAAIRSLGEELLAQHHADDRLAMGVAVHGVTRPLHPIVRDETFRIAGEALRNALRHAQASQIEVEIVYDRHQFRLRVRDDGKGIDPQVLERARRSGHFGLEGMRERAGVAGGRLKVWSALDAGTEIELTVPGANAYMASAEDDPAPATAGEHARAP